MLELDCAPKRSATRTRRRFNRASPNFASPNSAAAQLTTAVSVICLYQPHPLGGGGEFPSTLPL